MTAFILGIWIPLSTTLIPASLRTVPDKAGYLPSRSPDHEPCPAAGVIQVHDEVPGGLGDPGRGGVRGCAEDPDAAGGVLDDGQDEQAVQGRGLEEFAGEQCTGPGAEEAGPSGGGAVGRGVDPGVAEDLPYGGGGDFDAEDEQFAVDTGVAPPGILAGQAQHQHADGPYGAWPSRAQGAGSDRVAAC
jgi:hypothetical protein